MEQTQVEAVRSMTNKEVVVAILELQAQVKSLQEALAAKAPAQTTSKEMTDDDARAILNGIHGATKHKDAASALGLTYGQVYSCRLEYTFKHIHKELKEAGFKNSWVK